jgi:hypothetical protein
MLDWNGCLAAAPATVKDQPQPARFALRVLYLDRPFGAGAESAIKVSDHFPCCHGGFLPRGIHVGSSMPAGWAQGADRRE